MRTLTLWKFVTLVCIGFLAACDKSDENDYAESNRSETSDPKVLHRGNLGEADSIDPHKAMSSIELRIVGDLFMGLMTENAKGEIILGMAKQWIQSDDGLTHTFYLQENAAWSDGTSLTAFDFEYGMQRLMDPKTASPLASFLYDIQNGRAVNEGKLPLSDLGVAALDDNRLVITLDRPVPHLAWMLSSSASYPIPRHIVEDKGSNWIKSENIVCNGAFCLNEWVPYSFMELEKNQYFYEAEGVALDRVFYYPTSNPGSEFKRYSNGEFDLSVAVPSMRIKWILENFPEELHRHPVLSSYHILLNIDLDEFSDVRVRKALSLALDRTVLATKVSQKGMTPTTVHVPPALKLNREQYVISDHDKPLSERIKIAKSLLAQAGYSQDKPLRFLLQSVNSSDSRRWAVAMRAMWAEIFVHVEILEMEPATYYNDLQSGAYQAAISNWTADYPDPYNFLSMFISDPGTVNFSNWKSLNFDKILQESVEILDREERLKILDQAERLALEELAVIPFAFDTSNTLVHENVRGWEDNAMNIHRSRFLSKEGTTQ